MYARLGMPILMLVLALFAFGCEDDKPSKKDFLESCENDLSDCEGAAGEDAANCGSNNCSGDLDCAYVRSGTVCTLACSTSADCAGLASGDTILICSIQKCAVQCSDQVDCTRFGLDCISSGGNGVCG